MAALGWLLNLDFAAGGEAAGTGVLVPTRYTMASNRTRAFPANLGQTDATLSGTGRTSAQVKAT